MMWARVCACVCVWYVDACACASYSRLTWFCMLLKRVHPFTSATRCSRASCHANMDDAPMYLTFPLTTRSCSAFIVSSGAVWWS